jgi:hypothetical protein
MRVALIISACGVFLVLAVAPRPVEAFDSTPATTNDLTNCMLSGGHGAQADDVLGCCKPTEGGKHDCIICYVGTVESGPDKGKLFWTGQCFRSVGKPINPATILPRPPYRWPLAPSPEPDTGPKVNPVPPLKQP